MCTLAELYVEADTQLERPCTRSKRVLDTIELTADAPKRPQVERPLLTESSAAANELAHLFSLNRQLVCDHGVDTDEEHAVVFPIFSRSASAEKKGGGGESE